MTTSMKRVFGLAAAMAVVFAAGAAAQSAAQAGARGEPAARQAPGEMPQLKVQITMSRSKADAETTNLPFELMLRADGRSQTTLNVGVDVPVPQGPSGSYSYRRVGNNITCGSATYANGTITLHLEIEDSSIHTDAAPPGRRVETVTVPVPTGTVAVPAVSESATSAPMFRSFQTTTTLSMREGETVQFTLATDKQTGETLKVSVSASRVR